MNTSQNKYDSIENLIFNEGLKITSLDFSNPFDRILIHLNNDLVFIIPIRLFESLNKSNMESLKNYKLIAGGIGIYWPDLDEDLSLKGFLKDYLKQMIHTKKELVLS